MLGLSFPSKLDWSSYIVPTAKTTYKEIAALICSLKFLSPEVALYPYKHVQQPCMEYYCNVWAGVPNYYLDMQDRLRKWVCGAVGLLLAASFEPLAHG